MLSFTVVGTDGKHKVLHERSHSFPKMAFKSLIIRRKSLKNLLAT